MKILIPLAVAAFLIISCGDDDPSTSPTENQVGYSGPGSFWTANVGASTFTMERSPNFGDPVDLSVEGTVSTLASGYQEYEVTSASGSATGSIPAAGTKAYGLLIPGFLNLIHPPNTAPDNLIPMLVKGNCPTGDFDLNYVSTNHQGGVNLATSSDVVGVASYVHATTSFNTGTAFSLDGTNQGAPAQSLVATCADGFTQITLSGGGIVDMWLTAAGGAIVKTPDDKVILALEPESFAAADIQGKSFHGLVFNDLDTPKVKPIWFTANATGTSATAGLWTDVIANTKESAAAEITFSGFDQPSQGFLQGGMAVDTNNDGTFDATGGNLICQYAGNVQGSGSDILLCSGHTPQDNTKLYSIVLVAD